MCKLVLCNSTEFRELAKFEGLNPCLNIAITLTIYNTNDGLMKVLDVLFFEM